VTVTTEKYGVVLVHQRTETPFDAFRLRQPIELLFVEIENGYYFQCAFQHFSSMITGHKIKPAPFFIERNVHEQLGANVVSLFGAGCCGDINHSDPSRTERNKTPMIGGELGKTIRTALDRTTAVTNATLRVRSTTVRAPLQDVTTEQLAHAKELLTTVQSGKPVDFLQQVEAYRQVMVDQLRQHRESTESLRWIGWGLSHNWGGIGKELPLEVTTITFGSELAIVCLPGEVFVDLGLAIKRGSPFRTTLVIELANCVETVYIPTRAAFAGGSYEVTNSACLPGTGEALAEAALRLLREAATAAIAKP